MKSNYKKLGQFIREVSVKNKDLKIDLLLGVSITKKFIPSIANTVGTDMSTYKIVKKNQFAYGPVTSRNGDKISIALFNEEGCIISTSYTVFEIIDTELLDPEYLMMWFRRSEFDRYARYMSHGTVRELFGWDEMCDVELPIPSIEKQREIVREYNVVNDRIALNEQLIQKLEDTAQAIYKQWFVDFEFPISKEYAKSIGKPELEGQPYKSSNEETIFNKELDYEIPTYWEVNKLGHVTDMKYGRMLDSDKFISTGYPVFSGYGIRGYYDEFMYEYPEVLIICRGVSGTGKVVMSPPKAFITNLSIVVQPNDTTIQKYFLYFFLKFNNLRSLDSGSAQSMITIGDLEKIYILSPCKFIQKKFSNIVANIQTNMERIKTENLQLIELKNIITGQMISLE